MPDRINTRRSQTRQRLEVMAYTTHTITNIGPGTDNYLKILVERIELGPNFATFIPSVSG